MPNLTTDQKHALWIAGGVAVVGIAIYMSRGSFVPVGSDVQPGDGVAGQIGYTNSPPGYTSFNMQPLAPPPSIAPAPRTIPGVTGCGCNSGSDGCFTTDPNAGQGPVSLDQLLNWYSKNTPVLTNLIRAGQAAYQAPPATVIEQTSPSVIGFLGVPLAQGLYKNPWGTGVITL